MKHAFFALFAFVLGFVLIQFLVGSTGVGTIFNYGHAEGSFVFLSTVIGGALAALTFLCSTEFD